MAGLPPETHALVLRDLPVVELARYACVHKAFRVAWRILQEHELLHEAARRAAELAPGDAGAQAQLAAAAAVFDQRLATLEAPVMMDHGTLLAELVNSLPARSPRSRPPQPGTEEVDADDQQDDGELPSLRAIADRVRHAARPGQAGAHAVSNVTQRRQLVVVLLVLLQHGADAHAFDNVG